MLCAWAIFLTADKWDEMASCTKENYKSSQRPDECDYQSAQCKYNDHEPVSCKVRRKGSASWRDLHARPSFKIKKMKQNSTPYTFQENWITEKVTLNNGVQKAFADAEVKAYDTFRKLGVKAPLAQLCSLSLYRANTLQTTHRDYTMVETINDTPFMNKHFGDNWTLWEQESLHTECKRSYPNEDACDSDTMNPEELSLNDVDQTEMMNYFVGERITTHWDSACLGGINGNNYYVAKWYVQNVPRYTYIPSGVDQTFQCIYQYATAGFPQCKPVQECFRNEQCYESYNEIYHHAKQHIYDHVWPCITPLHKIAFALIGATAAGAIIT